MQCTSRLMRLTTAAWLLAGICPAIAVAQTTMGGRVTSEAGVPLANAAVSIPELRLGGQTDAEGRYSFTVPAANATGQTATLTARRLGYLASSVVVRVSGNAVVTDFRLTPVAAELSGVV